MFEEESHLIFAAVCKYFVIKIRYLGDTKAGGPSRLVELLHLCVRSALLRFVGQYQECLEIGVENKWHWKNFLQRFLNYLYFSPDRRVRYTPLSVLDEWSNQVGELRAAAILRSNTDSKGTRACIHGI